MDNNPFNTGITPSPIVAPASYSFFTGAPTVLPIPGGGSSETVTPIYYTRVPEHTAVGPGLANTLNASSPVSTPTAMPIPWIPEPSYQNPTSDASTKESPIWYSQEWTNSATWLLCCYSLVSLLTLAFMLYSGRLDYKGNLYFGRIRHERNHFLRQAIAHGTALSVTQASEAWNGLINRRIRRQHEAERARYTAVHEEQYREGLHDLEDRGETASVIETEINYEGEVRQTNPENDSVWFPPDLRDTIHSDISSRQVSIDRRGQEWLEMHTLPLGHYHTVSRNEYDAMVAMHRRTLMFRELQMLEESMEAAGWI